MARHSALSKALAKRLGVKVETADEVALRVLNYFGFGEDIIDNILDQEDRRLFYLLQDLGLLKTAWEEAILPSGRTWRIFYWYLNVENIEEHGMDPLDTREDAELYSTLPADAWARERAKA